MVAVRETQGELSQLQQGQPDSKAVAISVEEFLHAFFDVQAAEGQMLVDVRTPAEFRAAHVEFSKNIPLDRIESELLAGQVDPKTSVVFICQSGPRSRQACEQLRGLGWSQVRFVEGGMNACQGKGLPLVLGKKKMSLERQVRIAAGSLVLTGILLAVFVHPYLIALSVFVGAGLVFAGITDTFGMAVLLARMPWNR